MADVLSQSEVRELPKSLDPNFHPEKFAESLMDEIAQMERLEALRDLFEPYLGGVVHGIVHGMVWKSDSKP